MSNPLEKVKTMLWFLKNPTHVPQLFQLMKRAKNAKLEETRQESTDWCKSMSCSMDEAYNKLGINPQSKDLLELYPEYIKEAKQIEQNCPVKMGGEGAISFVYNICRAFQVKYAMESGVAYGWSSLAILLALKDEGDAFLVSNDMPYIKMNNEDYVGCIIPEELRINWRLQRLPDIKGIPRALKKMKQPLDLFHYDSDKSYTGRLWSSPLIWNQLKSGGLFISDDINDNLAFKHFAESVNIVPVIIEHNNKYVGVLIK